MKIKNLMVCAMLATLCTGCYSVGRRIDQDAVTKIKKGETTKAEVLKLLGSPDQIMDDGMGNTTWTYMFVKSTVSAATFIPIVGAFAGGSKTQHQTVTVSIGENNKVNQVFSMYGGLESGMGVTSGDRADMPDVEDSKRSKYKRGKTLKKKSKRAKWADDE